MKRCAESLWPENKNLTMKCFPVLLILYLSILKSAQSLDCYVTDFKAMEAEGDVRSSIKSCKDFFLEVSGQKNIPYFSNYKDNLRCFTVDVESDRVNFAIQGCALEDSCGKITNEVTMRRFSVVQDVRLYNMTCMECSEDKCNARVTEMFKKTSSEKTKYLIFTVVMILIFMVVVSVMLRAFSRKANIAKKKYALLNV